ncbi:MAG: PDDEXK nuclease domain-containing protein [Propionibacteriaceae bacterium]|jgi:predicted nuclease of restriction endonuclease-like (RecB) superfamily|nr:PDDEXK nuclease domain-containing protein [Propionibacteriaceae bacterium]
MEEGSGIMLMNTAEYLQIVAEVKSQIAESRRLAFQSVNTELIALYWRIGRLIDTHSQWGTSFVKNLSQDIRRDYPGIRGFSVRNLTYMATFARAYPDGEFAQSVTAQVTWTHHTVLLDKVSDPAIRRWYAEQATEGRWSVRALEDHIDSHTYERQVLPSKTTNFSERLPQKQAVWANEVLRDPYIFDFISAREGMVEREIGAELVRNISRFLIELGTGFAFVGEQYRVEVAGEDFYIDLLFYHLKLRCYVVVELKAGKFRPEYAGQLNFYVSVVDDLVASDDDNPTIGLLLCKSKQGLVAEYAFQDINKPIGVSEYRLFDALPSQYEDLLPSADDIETRLGLALPDESTTDTGDEKE